MNQVKAPSGARTANKGESNQALARRKKKGFPRPNQSNEFIICENRTGWTLLWQQKEQKGGTSQRNPEEPVINLSGGKTEHQQGRGKKGRRYSKKGKKDEMQRKREKRARIFVLKRGWGNPGVQKCREPSKATLGT